MRATVIAVLLALLQGCGFTLLRDDLTEFYSNPALVTAEIVSEAPVQVTMLDAPGFTEQYGRKGLWQPLSFVREVHGGVYLLEPYDPNRIPVLFVHGAGGTPQDWRYSSRTSPHALPSVGVLLPDRPADRDQRPVAQQVRERLAREVPLRAAGRDGAQHGRPGGPALPYAQCLRKEVQRAARHVADPVSPDSVFLRRLHAEPLPAGIKHHLFFAYRSDGDEYDSDGVITVGSQLAGHEQAGSQLHGFRTDHSAILEDASVFDRFTGVLAGFN